MTQDITLIKKIMLYIGSSHMDDEERWYWMKLIPIMNNTELKNFSNILEKEVLTYTDISLAGYSMDI